MPSPMKKTTALQYENRMGVLYYLQEGKTSTGKPKYYTARKLTGVPLEVLPDGYEIYERPENAQVVVRKVKPSPITEFERKQVEDIVRRTSGLDHFIVDIEDHALVIYTAAMNRAEGDHFIAMLAGTFPGIGSSAADSLRETIAKKMQYTPMLRFNLVDPDKRIYFAQRWCFRGSIDGWFLLGRPGTLAKLVEEYAPHLDRESFFELM